MDASAQSKRLKKAIDKYNYQFYPEAIDLLKEEVRENKSAYTPLKYLAGSYRKIKEYQKAELYYNLLVNSDSAQAEDHLYYGQVLKSNGKLALAKEQFIIFQELEESSFLSKLMLQSLDQIEEWDKERKVYRSVRMDWINSKHSEYGAMLFRDKLYITSDRQENLTTSGGIGADGQRVLSIYEMDTALLKNKIARFEEVYGRINTLGGNDGPLTINEQQDRAMVSRAENQMRGKQFVNQIKMYEGEYEKGRWRNFKAFPYNSNDYSVGYAHYTNGGNTLYFASDMPGGQGGLDLYVSQRVDGKWTKPRNLGPRINTQKNEVFPFIKGEELYFSSNGFPGYGEQDIFFSSRSDTGWTTPENLRSPINSNRDDFGIFFTSDTSGYYASNRAGGKGKDDIYGFIRYESIQVKGVVQVQGAGVEGAKVLLVNENDSVIGEAITGPDGTFVFKNLAYQEDYMIKVESDEPELVENSRLFILDDEGAKVQSIQKLDAGEFQLTALPADEILELQALKAVDDVEMAEMDFSGQVFENEPGDLEEGVMVYLTDDMGFVIDSARTDSTGKFEFNKLPPSENYMIKIKEVDEPLSIAFINEDERVYSVEEVNEEGAIAVKSSMDASKLVEEAKNKGYTSLIARFENNGEPIKNTVVEIYDQDDSLIATVVTNNKGEFQYNMLEYDKHYFLRAPDLEDSLRDDALLYLIREDGAPLYLIDLLDNGSYEFQSLPFEEYELEAERRKRLIPREVSIAGRMYSIDEEEDMEGLTIYLIGEDEVLRDSVKTDSIGEFGFDKLNPYEQYSFSLDKPSSNYIMVLVDEEGNVIEKAFLTEEERFKYEKLTYQVAQFEQLDLEEAKLLEDQFSHTVEGKVFREAPGDLGKKKLFIYDTDGNLLESTTIDKEGNFEFKKLDPEQNYIFKLEDDDEATDYTMVTFDEKKKVQSTTIRKQGKTFVYSPLGFIEHKMPEEETSDKTPVAYSEDELEDFKKKLSTTEPTVEVTEEDKSIVIFYAFDKSTLSTEALDKLKKFISPFNNGDFNIEISSHTDQRGPSVYNEYLSKLRTTEVSKYLKDNGISSGRIIEKWYGESQLIIDCEQKACDNKDHRLNRRSEIRIIERD